MVVILGEARHALDDLHLLLKSSKCGHKGIRHQNLPRIIIKRVDQMTRFLWTYVDTQPANPTGGYWASPISDEAVVEELSIHLRSIGKYACAQDLVDFLKVTENRARLGISRPISLATAHRWMKYMGWRWKKEVKGQYVDGHECSDVVAYRQQVFLPAWTRLQSRMRKWEVDQENDNSVLRWVHQNESAVPQPKGEGASLMVADFVSADYGWLRSPDGKEHARVLFKAGKTQDGYFTNDDIVAQTGRAMDVLSKHYTNKDRVFIFDNTKTHLKRANDALSARKMPKFPSESWGGHERAGWFKGMAQILVERGYTDASRLPAECKDFKCPPDRTDCCCRRLMYSQSDFANVESIIETTCRSRGFEVIFLPKFHCELSFIEQCWGFSKRVYRMKPRPSLEEMLERRVVESLEAVPLDTMRRFATRSSRFMDTYLKGLDGRQAAWAIKRYRGHRILPASILEEFDAAHPLSSTN
ncbi:hypothetical protein SCLCIDRAFT_16731 [Scleroderma citrinum Foug A]|uniref:Tc1-like transposase DDE domain-containing protein n=1 Tax=Scleroderma citrinum Foug A TaxID=1036808 RepID=A0A0C3A1X8_9AGAM|nr:hypothetical protein SCLCIDRAFT_16731 [Scleroderma citrinum Foug A]